MSYTKSFFGATGLPSSTGRVFYVAPSSYTLAGNTYSSSDNHSGLDPRRALATINQAVTNATADVGDTIVIIGALTPSATSTISKAGLRIFGIPGITPSVVPYGTLTSRYSSSIIPTAGVIFTVTAARTEIAFLHLVPVAGAAIIDLAADDLNLHDITTHITSAANTATFGISVTGASARPQMSNIYAYVSDNQGPLLRAAAASTGMDGGVFQRSRVVLAGTTAWDDVIEITTGVDNFTVADCEFMHSSGAIMTDIVDVAGNTNDHAVMVARCYHQVAGDLTEATATSDITLVNNYIATIQGGTGGTLSTG